MSVEALLLDVEANEPLDKERNEEPQNPVAAAATTASAPTVCMDTCCLEKLKSTSQLSQ